MPVRMRFALAGIFLLGGLLGACVPGLPEPAWHAAQTAVCDSPLVPGHNLCREARFAGFAELVEGARLFTLLDNTRQYCVVVVYVDFTGETGTAFVQVSGPDDSGEYRAEGGPLFNHPCFK